MGCSAAGGRARYHRTAPSPMVARPILLESHPVVRRALWTFRRTPRSGRPRSGTPLIAEVVATAWLADRNCPTLALDRPQAYDLLEGLRPAKRSPLQGLTLKP